MEKNVSTEQTTSSSLETKPQLPQPIAEPLAGMELLDQATDALASELQSQKSASTVSQQAQQQSAQIPAEFPSNRAGLRRLSVLIPMYNEQWTVADVIRRVAAVALPIELEIIAIDDGSTDSSADVVAALQREIPRLRLIRQGMNEGKGSAIRRGIEEMTGDVAVIQDADLEYDPNDLPSLLRPILDDEADAVFGSRFSGSQLSGSMRRCLPFWHTQINRALTLASNMVTGVSLTDMETGYKVIRGDLLRELRLQRRSFTIEPEIVCRLAQWGARMVEVPISYEGRSFEEGKKIRPRDGVKALLTMLGCRFVDSQYSHFAEDSLLRSMRRAKNYNASIIEMSEPFLGMRVLDAGAGVGTLSSHLLRRERVVMVEADQCRARRLVSRFGRRGNVRIEQADLADRELIGELVEERIDSIFAANVLQQIGPDFLTLRNFHKMLPRGGQCVVVVPHGPHQTNQLDRGAGNERRYEAWHLGSLMERAGFDVIHSQAFNRLGGIGWWINGSLAGRSRFGSVQTAIFDRLWPVARHIDRWLPGPPLSLMMVGRKE